MIMSCLYILNISSLFFILCKDLHAIFALGKEEGTTFRHAVVKSVTSDTLTHIQYHLVRGGLKETHKAYP
jgi:hypothetical protein